MNLKNKKPQVIVIVGTTATGKSDLAVFLAKKLDGEVISADSRQVYKYMNIGTGKITKKEMKGIKHHLLSIIYPKEVFSVADFKKIAEEKIEKILKKNKVPIICGGTGFYVDAILNNTILPEVKPNFKLRKSLANKSKEELFEILSNLDKERAEDIAQKNEINNKVRLIRAIEIAQKLGSVPKLPASNPKWDFIQIGLNIDQKNLELKVKKRVHKMFQDGLLKEIARIKKMVSKERIKEFGFEYTNQEEDVIIKETLKYAKRQKTWFKRNKNIKWFDPKDNKKILKYVLEQF